MPKKQQAKVRKVSKKEKLEALLKREYLRGYIAGAESDYWVYTPEELERAYKKYRNQNRRVSKDIDPLLPTKKPKNIKKLL